MYLNKTFKKFFKKDDSYDIYWFIFGLVILFVFAFLSMPYWIFCLGIGVLTSAIFRYITTDALFYDDFKNLDNRKDRLNYILSKNIFTIFFLASFVFILYILSILATKLGFVSENEIDLGLVFIFLVYILMFENINLIFNNKMIPSYKSGHKRNIKEDIKVGTENLKSLLPSLFVNIILIILIFMCKINLTIFTGIVNFLASMFVFTIYKTC